MMKGEDRTTLRRRILAVRDRISLDSLEERSLAVTARVLDLPVLKMSPVVFVYMHFRSEVRTGTLIRALLALGSTVCVPQTVPVQSRLQAIRISNPDQEVAPGFRGIPEPLPRLLASAVVAPRDINAVIVPGAVFDREGGRLGYGGGYYDRFLGLEAREAVRIALSFELQLVKKVPMEPHDQYMDFVVTEKEVFVCGRNRYAQDSRIP
jgi:5-formyltetrahydrofolate cyclo-ligase